MPRSCFFSALLFLLAFLATPLSAHAQENVPLEDSFLFLNEPGSEQAFIDALINVYRNNPQLGGQRASLEATDETVSQAVSGFRPSIAYDYSRGRQRSQVGNSGDSIQSTTSRELNLTQDIFNGGETLATWRGAKDRVRAARAQLLDVEQQVFLAAIGAYVGVVESDSVLRLNQNNVDVLQKQLDATQARFDVGELTRTDVAQAQARLALARADERQALGDFETAQAAFRRVIGYEAPLPLGLPPIPASLPQTLSEAAETARARHPQMELAERLEKAAQSDVDARIGGLLPDVNITAGTGNSQGGSASGVRRFESDEIRLNVTIPLYQSGAEWSRVRQAKSTAQQARYNTYDTRDAVQENVARAWQDFHTSQSLIVSNEESVRAAELALEGVKQENQYGERTILDVLNAEQELFSAKVNLVRAQASAKQQAYGLLAAVGKLTAQELGLPLALYDPKSHYNNVKYKLIGF